MSEPFQQLIERDEIAVVPGVFDALTAKIAEDVGFEALYLGGYVVGSSIAPSLIRVDMLYELYSAYGHKSPAEPTLSAG